MSEFFAQICSLDMDDFTSEAQLSAQCPSLEELDEDLRVKEMKKRSLISCPMAIGKNYNLAVKMYCTVKHASIDSPTWLDARTNEPLVTETRWICKDTGFWFLFSVFFFCDSVFKSCASAQFFLKKEKKKKRKKQQKKNN